MSPEILAPAGDMLSARAALLSGADAVYLGLTSFSARSGAENFGVSALKELAEFAHLLGAKVYVCLNTLVKDGELSDFFGSAAGAWNAGADALLLQDMLLGRRLKEECGELVLHLSTQAGCCNVRGARLAKECGFSRVVLARETPLGEIEKISGVIETEAFVQGALCSSFSGQCYFSSFAGNNSGNRGRCKQPCRKRYSIDRAGFEEFAYALSPSDLCVGERVKELLGAGVSSLKIEGRMRRPEYVAAAVRYYRALLAGKTGGRERSDLMRAYNRGDYTAGLAFGQDGGFLSRDVQGHIGERVGEMVSADVCKSGYPAAKGDGFKLLRGGKEVGGALFAERCEGGFRILPSAKPMRGDEVRLTTEAGLMERLAPSKKRPVSLRVRMMAGERAEVSCGNLHFYGDVLPTAKSAPLSAEEIAACFRKTDGLPLEADVRVQTDGVFLARSALNALRREFYGALKERLLPKREEIALAPPKLPPLEGGERRLALISEEFEGLTADILIYKPRDDSRITAGEVAKGRGEKYLYLPPFLTSADEERLLPVLPLFCGIYCDGYYGLSLAKERGMKFFAGTGFPLTNRVSAAEAVRMGADEYALSKEISAREQREIGGGFALAFGSVKLMDLCYCPFGRQCASCDGRDLHTLTDEEGRSFPLRRYRMGGQCRFEVYNHLPLAAEGGGNVLADLTCMRAEDAKYALAPSEYPLPATRGHSTRSML